MTAARVRMLAAAALFVGWMGWLGTAALTKYRGPVVSRAAAAAADAPLVADLVDGDEGQPAEGVVVADAWNRFGPPAGTKLDLPNLPDAHGYAGPGRYLLLARQTGPAGYELAVPGRGPGAEGGGRRPVVYPWTPGVEAQVRALFP